MTGNLAPDHSTIAEFGCRYGRPLGGVFCGVPGLCARAGLVSVGVVAIEGTKMVASASSDADRDLGQIAREILAEAAEVDRREGELCGSERGDELPEQLGRRLALREAEERLARERDDAPEAPLDEPPVTIELAPGQFVTPPAGPSRLGSRGAPRVGGRARTRGPPDRQRPDRPAV